ncbi:peptidoglycan editing factor PgeF [Erythrobacteraceae bacterium CFH 75059]|uniref:peptidoglycan editing factor PgeF n=1 Tax=Qipengyuania thermophila TaxID=2509361 RepID=UPI00101F011D|nr:peptidoglycan editing factor PgeF [Qipengyuania thermophila]TCD06764.1 peptidoglycan editing factor PgeF [Erythrobacteraceae bacterium CFH 75059]
MRSTDGPERIEAEALRPALHGFFGRSPAWREEDGVEQAAAQERSAAAVLVPGRPLIRLRQVHSATCLVVDGDGSAVAGRCGDALVTRSTGVVLGIVTADCAPVLLADPAAGVVGAAHAGWRGAVAGVLENTVAAMVRLGASRENVRAVAGPAIAAQSYEVDEPFRAHFAADDARFFAAGRPGHFRFDLPAFVIERLRRAGVGHAEALALDTFALPQRFHSYRRDRQSGAAGTGRQLSAIALPAPRH